MNPNSNKSKYFRPNPLLDEKSAVPLHHQIAENILKEIIKLRVPSGTPVISERIFASQLGLSRTTVHKAYDKLLMEKVIEQEPGGRIYYISNDIMRNYNFSSFSSLGIMMPEKFSSYTTPDALGTLDYFAGVMDGASEKTLSVTIISMPSENEGRKRIELWTKNLISKLSGIIYLGCRENDYATELILNEKSIPHVFISGTSPLSNIASVMADVRPGLMSACQHLKENGHARVGILSVPEAVSRKYFIQEWTGRRNAMIEATKESKLECRPEWILTNCDKEENIINGIKQILSSEEYPAAFLCHNDDIALKALTILKKLNIKVPQDISLIGFDDTFSASVSDPPLTTVKKHRYIIGMKSVSLLMEALKNINNSKSVTEYVPTSLVIRGSSGKAPKTGESA